MASHTLQRTKKRFRFEDFLRIATNLGPVDIAKARAKLDGSVNKPDYAGEMTALDFLAITKQRAGGGQINRSRTE
jgi:hypothetical protein